MQWLTESLDSFKEMFKGRLADVLVILFICWSCILTYHFLMKATGSSLVQAPVAHAPAVTNAPAAPENQQSVVPVGPSDAAIKQFEKQLASYNACTAKLEKIRKNAEGRWNGYQQLQDRCDNATNESARNHLCDLASKQKIAFDSVAAQANFSCQQPVPPT